MRTFLVVLCIAILATYLIFQAALAMIKLAFAIGSFLAVAAGFYLIYVFFKTFFKKRTA